MFCSACGASIPSGQAACPHCGQPSVPTAPPAPGLEFELLRYRGDIKVLAIAWYVYAGLSLLLGITGLSFARLFFMGHFGPWMHGPIPPGIPPGLISMAMHLVWIAIVVRAALAFVTGWALMEHRQWGRIFAIVIAILNLLKFPVGTALGVWTLVMLLGYRNSTLYARLQTGS